MQFYDTTQPTPERIRSAANSLRSRLERLVSNDADLNTGLDPKSRRDWAKFTQWLGRVAVAGDAWCERHRAFVGEQFAQAEAVLEPHGLPSTETRWLGAHVGELTALLVLLALLASPVSASWWSYHTLVPWLVCPAQIEIEGSGGTCFFDDDEEPYASHRPLEAVPLAFATPERCEYAPLCDVAPGGYFIFIDDDTAVGVCVGPHTSEGEDLTIILRTRPPIFSDGFESGSTGAWSKAVGE